MKYFKDLLRTHIRSIKEHLIAHKNSALFGGQLVHMLSISQHESVDWSDWFKQMRTQFGDRAIQIALQSKALIKAVHEDEDMLDTQYIIPPVLGVYLRGQKSLINCCKPYWEREHYEQKVKLLDLEGGKKIVYHAKENNIQ